MFSTLDNGTRTSNIRLQVDTLGHHLGGSRTNHLNFLNTSRNIETGVW